MFIRSYRIHLLLVTIFSFYPTFGMELPLCTEEKEIFLWAVKLAADKVGLSLILERLNLAQQVGQTAHITLKFYNANIDQNPLIKHIFDVIIFKDQAFGYIPDGAGENGNRLSFNGSPTNYLGNYTRYWHREDKQGPYIQFKSKFKNIKLLQDALAEKEKK